MVTGKYLVRMHTLVTVAKKGHSKLPILDFYFSVSDFQSRISKIIISKSLVNHTNIYLGSAVCNTSSVLFERAYKSHQHTASYTALVPYTGARPCGEGGSKVNANRLFLSRFNSFRNLSIPIFQSLSFPKW